MLHLTGAERDHLLLLAAGMKHAGVFSQFVGEAGVGFRVGVDKEGGVGIGEDFGRGGGAHLVGLGVD